MSEFNRRELVSLLARGAAIAGLSNTAGRAFTAPQTPGSSHPLPWEAEGRPVPDFLIKPVAEYPALIVGPDDLPTIRKRYETIPWHPAPGSRSMDPGLYGLLYADDAFKKLYTAQWLTKMKTMFDVKADGPIPSYRRYSEAIYSFDVVAGLGFLSEADRVRFRDMMLRGAQHYVGPDSAHFASQAMPLHNGVEYPTGFAHGNRWTDSYILGGLVGLAFPELPQSHDLVKYAVMQTRWQLDNDLWPGGAWDEVPRYHNWTLLLFVGWFKALKRRAGIDFFQDPVVRQLVDWPVRFSSGLVRLPEIVKDHPNGQPTTPAWGDSNYTADTFTLCAMYAPEYIRTHPEFARRLMWMWRRAGSPYQHGWQFDTIFPFLVDPSIPDTPQVLGSAFSRAPGYTLLRSGFDRRDETTVTMRSGEAHNHRRNDLGSIDLFSCGIPLACGAQSGPYHEPELEWNRWVGANNAVAFVGNSSQDAGPANPYVDIPGLQSNPSGKPLAFFSSPTVDYTVMSTSNPQRDPLQPGSNFHWVRHVVLLKQPDYLVVWDQCRSEMASKWFLHTTAERYEWKQDRVIAHTAYNVDLDIHVLGRQSPLNSQAKEGPFGGWFYDNPPHGKTDPYPFLKLKYITLDASPNQDYVTVWHPRPATEDALSATLASSTDDQIEVQVLVAGRVDQISLSSRGGTYHRGSDSPIALPMTLPGDFEAGYQSP